MLRKIIFALLVSVMAAGHPVYARILAVGQGLAAGEVLSSDNGKFHLTLQRADGNLVFYFEGHALWQAGTAGLGGTRAIMQADGNFVLYTDAGVPVWALKTGRPGSYLNVQDDGNFVLYWDRPLWRSGTRDAHQIQDGPAYVLYPNHRISAGESYTIGAYFLIFQADGNLVLYRDGAAVWRTGTAGKGATVGWQQADGNFVVLNDAGQPLWSTGTQAPRAFLAFQPDGELVLYNSTPTWDRFNGFNHPTVDDPREPGRAAWISHCYAGLCTFAPGTGAGFMPVLFR
jgi:hypothetical protein